LDRLQAGNDLFQKHGPNIKVGTIFRKKSGQ
jgi:hypothetical protein